MSKFWVMIVQNLIQGNELLFSLETLVLRLSHVSQLLTFFHIETITFSSFQSVLDLHYLVFSVLFVFLIILCLYASFLWCCCHRFWLVFLSNLRGFGQHFVIPLFGHQVGLIQHLLGNTGLWCFNMVWIYSKFLTFDFSRKMLADWDQTLRQWINLRNLFTSWQSLVIFDDLLLWLIIELKRHLSHRPGTKLVRIGVLASLPPGEQIVS